MTKPRPHYDKLMAAISNPKSEADVPILKKALKTYEQWIEKTNSLSSSGERRVREMVELLNWYKDELEIELIMKNGTNFLKRQKGQLKLDSSVLEEFLVNLIDPNVLVGFEGLDKIVVGPKQSFMSLAFAPHNFKELTQKPEVVLKTKDQDFIIGSNVFYKFSSDEEFSRESTSEGQLNLSVLAAECKINLDKTMFQEAAGTAGRLKQGCPVAKYFLLVEWLDMAPEDCRLTAIDNVFLLRHAKRLPFEKRDVVKEVENAHKTYPIDPKVVWQFTQEIHKFIGAVWYDPDEALRRGAFI